ncbi:hypothetical protein SAMN04515671_2222 [Nakamurella panacisegetis]|uniref:Pyridinium-3,5-bisthiocarboxylic acid mononucleotide nickel insertion protein n=1 Tax=Nakamurella panacisegetis TaxID=1090615 RepID=A0A1H0N655_9ACTN|nr:nickel pincer cofactor biosynthesis protein LarC [Nakamurella panacisegetis]SDO88163.1 hypothetical protein SAMN04515671_2222 [Nakamurella panacisegetis]
MTHLWIDPSAGVAGDMLLGALLDAGADLTAVQGAIDSVVARSVRLRVEAVTRAGQRATKAHVDVLVDDPPHRTWRTVRGLLDGLPGAVGVSAQAVFERLARAEGHVHGIDPEQVHFHEVGALDSIADVVGVCAAVADLGVTSISAGAVALGSGQVRVAHGTIPVPVPAVAQLALGWPVSAGGDGELTTPTGMALLAALARPEPELPAMVMRTVGVGAGTRDITGRANVTRILLGDLIEKGSPATSAALILQANVDDLDPRLWPGVLQELLISGADDVWLTPILMKKGRPAHTLNVLCRPERADGLRDRMYDLTSTIGVRQVEAAKHALRRFFVDVDVDGGPVSVKIALRDGVVSQVTPEFDSVAARAAALSRSQPDVLRAAELAARAAGWHQGVVVPPAAPGRTG